MLRNFFWHSYYAIKQEDIAGSIDTSENRVSAEQAHGEKSDSTESHDNSPVKGFVE